MLREKLYRTNYALNRFAYLIAKTRPTHQKPKWFGDNFASYNTTS
jgi:hypothetical protein